MAEQSKRYQLGLALSGGSAKGFAHLGVLKYLEEIGRKPDVISGTSSGALIAAFYADGHTPDNIVELLSRKGFMAMTNFQIPQGGMFSTRNFHVYLESNLKHKRIEDLNIPLYIPVTDLDHGKCKVFSSGSLVDIVVASCSIPVLFNPVIIDGIHYVDGGLYKNFPVSIIRPLCDTVIGVNLGLDPSPIYKKSLLSIADRCFQFIFQQNAQNDRQLCDILLESPDITGYSMFEINSARGIMQLGYEMAKKCIEEYNHEQSDANNMVK
ncbi:patatin-like phospholipase family protein [Porphyromonas pogonae]|uniref:patatin-like phospholipase family protein n=1 Tax=Porphyromonas pogonae TaxID=867595 RepID=UPI002E7A8C1A|nr:patatin-like phospholipase family protein [Porphyromonas pogonae]